MTATFQLGEIVDILLDVTNPGVWMALCHIAEHHESGMMFNFHVDPGDAAPGEPVAADGALDVAPGSDQSVRTSGPLSHRPHSQH